jgi:hypothetical protein
MPLVLRVKGYRFFFFSSEGQEPPHIHVEQAERYARLPESMIGHLKVLANKRDIPYQSLLKQFLAERLERELSRGA